MFYTFDISRKRLVVVVAFKSKYLGHSAWLRKCEMAVPCFRIIYFVPQFHLMYFQYRFVISFVIRQRFLVSEDNRQATPLSAKLFFRVFRSIHSGMTDPVLLSHGHRLIQIHADFQQQQYWVQPYLSYYLYRSGKTLS